MRTVLSTYVVPAVRWLSGLNGGADRSFGSEEHKSGRPATTGLQRQAEVSGRCRSGAYVYWTSCSLASWLARCAGPYQMLALCLLGEAVQPKKSALEGRRRACPLQIRDLMRTSMTASLTGTLQTHFRHNGNGRANAIEAGCDPDGGDCQVAALLRHLPHVW